MAEGSELTKSHKHTGDAGVLRAIWPPFGVIFVKGSSHAKRKQKEYIRVGR